MRNTTRFFLPSRRNERVMYFSVYILYILYVLAKSFSYCFTQNNRDSK